MGVGEQLGAEADAQDGDAGGDPVAEGSVEITDPGVGAGVVDAAEDDDAVADGLRHVGGSEVDDVDGGAGLGEPVGEPVQGCGGVGLEDGDARRCHGPIV